MKYAPYPAVPLENRQWPKRTTEKAPIWCSVDLRDGNQALPKPMNVLQRLRFFELLVGLGFKEIEVAFPAASSEDFTFVRHLIENDIIPEDVTIQVIMPGRPELIDRTFEAVKGAKEVILHLYFSTSELHQRIVFCKEPDELRDMIWRATEYITKLAEKSSYTKFHYEFSPESFTGTALDFALNVCQGCVDIWKPTAERKIILNLPATVELSTPNVFADQVEWFCGNLPGRDKCIISVHPHNDRGTAVAAAELALLGGADRVEGTLFGAGERTGNVDVVTLALNLFTQGVNPGLDFKNIKQVVEVFESCMGIPIHPRHPYAGDLVFIAYAGSHQDAIRKGLRYRQRRNEERWEVPYLPIDPHDLGHDYDRLIGITSQSGKAGVAYIVETHLGIELPGWLARDFSALVQKIAENRDEELDPKTIVTLFERTYLHQRLVTGKHRQKFRSRGPDLDSQNPDLKNYVSGLLSAANRKFIVRRAEASQMLNQETTGVITFLRLETDQDRVITCVGIAESLHEAVETALAGLA